MKSKYLPLLLALCSVGSLAGAASAPQKIKVVLTDHSITLDVAAVKPGRVVFEVANGSDSQKEHEFVVLRSDLDPAHLPVKKGKVEEDKLKSLGEIEGIKPGKTKRLSLYLKRGHYSLICNVAGHYEMGMNAGLLVQQ